MLLVKRCIITAFRWRGPATITMLSKTAVGARVWFGLFMVPSSSALLLSISAETFRMPRLALVPMQALDSLRGRGTTTFLDLQKSDASLFPAS